MIYIPPTNFPMFLVLGVHLLLLVFHVKYLWTSWYFKSFILVSFWMRRKNSVNIVFLWFAAHHVSCHLHRMSHTAVMVDALEEDRLTVFLYEAGKNKFSKSLQKKKNIALFEIQRLHHDSDFLVHRLPGVFCKKSDPSLCKHTYKDTWLLLQSIESVSIFRMFFILHKLFRVLFAADTIPHARNSVVKRSTWSMYILW